MQEERPLTPFRQRQRQEKWRHYGKAEETNPTKRNFSPSVESAPRRYVTAPAHELNAEHGILGSKTPPRTGVRFHGFLQLVRKKLSPRSRRGRRARGCPRSSLKYVCTSFCLDANSHLGSRFPLENRAIARDRPSFGGDNRSPSTVVLRNRCQ